ncbi:MAG: hypothetical protein LC714_00785 [Actinobacteria bacterium]|nr:hypothetical protein [Actinomycetota bacterium]
MTEEELIRFALVLREAGRVRMQIAKDEAHADGHGDSLASSTTEERSFGPAMVAAA